MFTEYEFKCSFCGNDQLQEVFSTSDYIKQPISNIRIDGDIDMKCKVDDTVISEDGKFERYECTACNSPLKDDKGEIINDPFGLPKSPDTQQKKDKQ